MRAVEQCPVCGGRDFRPYGLDSFKGQLHFAQARCAACGLLAAQPQASPEDMETYYRSAYYERHWPDPHASTTSNLHAYLRYELPLMQELWREWPPPPNGSVVEVGCGYGAMLGLLASRGFRVQGCDLSEHAVEYCRGRGLQVMRNGVPGAPFIGPFDVVLAQHVIEHVIDPRAFVQALVALARPGGIVVIVTDDAWNTQYAWDRMRDRLRGAIPRFRSSTDHTFVFGADHLRRLLLDSGCDEVRTRAFSYTPEAESVHWRLFKGAFRVLDRLIGHGDYLIAVGRMRTSRS